MVSSALVVSLTLLKSRTESQTIGLGRFSPRSLGFHCLQTPPGYSLRRLVKPMISSGYRVGAGRRGAAPVGEKGARAAAARARVGRGCPPPHRGRRQIALLLLAHQPDLVTAPSEPSCFCSLYSTSIRAKFMLTESNGSTWPLCGPPDWKELISTSLRVSLRYSCWSLPALRQVSTTLGMCWPLQQARNNFGDALLVIITKEKSCRLALPVPPPPPWAWEPCWLAPKL